MKWKEGEKQNYIPEVQFKERPRILGEKPVTDERRLKKLE